MQFHQGTRLKKFVELSHLKVKDISEKSGVAISSLHDLYKKPEVLWSRIEPILQVLNVTRDEFYKVSDPVAGRIFNEDQAPYGANEIISALQSENTALKEQIVTLKKMVTMLERKK